MEHLNSTIIEGNLVRDPELREAKNGAKYCRFAIASNRNARVGDQFETAVSFIDISTWGRAAESVANSCKKGNCVRVVGKLRQERWENAEGKKCSKLVIYADHVEQKASLIERQQAAIAAENAEKAQEEDVEKNAVETVEEEATF